MRYNWANSYLEDAAKALLAVNPLGYSNAEDLAEHIRYQAESQLTKPGILGTGGWYVTAFEPDYKTDYDLHMVVTIMPFVVNLYVDKVAKVAANRVAKS